MPGTRAGDVSEKWFEECFGMKEKMYFTTQRNFRMDGDVLVSRQNRKRFHVGSFEVLTVKALQQLQSRSECPEDAGSLTFKNSIGDIRALHLDSANEGAVFQVMSQFNCLQMMDPRRRAENGVTDYANDKTQGPACALSCPAALIYRNYLCNDGCGQGYTNPIDCLSHIGQEVRNMTQGFWHMQNGFCMPNVGGIGTLGKMIEDDKGLAATLHSKLAVGIHWDTEVDGGTHRVCQVFSSAAPVAFTTKSSNADDWAPFARLLLAATFDATLTVATILAAQRKARVTVYLTAVGAGTYGNRANWIAEGIEQALSTHAAAPLDVVLVHCAALPADGPYKSLENARDAPDSAVGAAGAMPMGDSTAAADGSKPDDVDKTVMERSPLERIAAANEKEEEEEEAMVAEAAAKPAEVAAEKKVGPEEICNLFRSFDVDNTGYLTPEEFRVIFQHLDPDHWVGDRLDDLVQTVDKNRNGCIEIEEFVAWLHELDAASKMKVMQASKSRLIQADFDPDSQFQTIDGLFNDMRNPCVTLKEAVKTLPDGLLAAIRTEVWLAQKFAKSKGKALLKKYPGLDGDGAAAIFLYTCETPLYEAVNSKLRSRKRNDADFQAQFFPYIRILVEALRIVAGETPEKTVVTRGVPSNLVQKYPDSFEEGETLIFWAFSSCTQKINTVKDFLGPTGGGTIFQIHTSKGAPIDEFSAIDGEHEHLLPPGTALTIDSVLNVGPLTVVQCSDDEDAPPLLK